MFYCDPCSNERNSPEGIRKSHGSCELCGEVRLCNDVPCALLPELDDEMEEQDMTQARAKKMETIIPVGLRVLICKDEGKKETRGGIILPDSVEIPVLTGRVVAVSAMLENDIDFPIKQFDKVIVDPSRCLPVECENDNKLFVIPVEDVVAVIRKEK